MEFVLSIAWAIATGCWMSPSSPTHRLGRAPRAAAVPVAIQCCLLSIVFVLPSLLFFGVFKTCCRFVPALISRMVFLCRSTDILAFFVPLVLRLPALCAKYFSRIQQLHGLVTATMLANSLPTSLW